MDNFSKSAADYLPDTVIAQVMNYVPPRIKFCKSLFAIRKAISITLCGKQDDTSKIACGRIKCSVIYLGFQPLVKMV